MTPPEHRIATIDVLRGFALIGILLMNIDFFNRPMSTMELGMPAGLAGIDWLAAYLVAYLVQGKFWTIFTTLFGMGFAIMLERAERNGHAFLPIYLRRVLALAVFGALHFLLLWDGEILLSYAVSAVALLILWYARWKILQFAIPALLLAGAVFKLGGLVLAGGALGYLRLISLYLHKEGGADKTRRILRLGVCAYIVFTLGACVFFAAQYLLPPAPPPPNYPPVVAIAVEPGQPSLTPGPLQKAAAKAEKEKREREAEREEAKRATEHEARLLKSGTYAEVVLLRAAALPKKLVTDIAFALLIVNMFLIGIWFVRSGVIANAREHLPLFRKLAMIGLPLGLGISLCSSLVGMSSRPDLVPDPYDLGFSLIMLSDLPASLGYIGLVVLMLHSRGGLSRISVLAPFGQMALTNYFLQSLVCASVFYGYGLGWYGLPRARQIVFALGLCAVLIAFSHWWLARFRYGPLEWLWRGFTYRTIPPLRLARHADA